jgi:serine/threonine-protein kinase
MQPGDRVGPFDIEKRIGSGAMGAVYRARYRKNGQLVAIKVMAAGLDGNKTALARFEREASVLKQFDHPNIVRFYAGSYFQGSPYYAMEFIEGEPLDKVFHRRGRFTWEEVVEIGKQICAALQHAHTQGIIHRDLKPSNLMRTADGTLKLTDFGIAKDLDVTQLTSANCTVGTAAYMSPEQCKGERNLTHKSDLYSLGVLFYELLTGEKPFRAETTMDMFLLHVQGAFERPARKILSIPVWLDNLVCQLLEKKPEHRPLDASVVAKALDQVAEKVATLQSAGVDAAKMRLVDRVSHREIRLDKEDTQVARTIITGIKGGRRKKTRKRFYQRGLLQGLALSALLAGAIGILYVAFRPPAPEVLFLRAQNQLRAAADLETRRDIRAGPILEYLQRYGNIANERTAQMRRWSDEILTESAWRGLRNRRKLGAEGEGETAARAALQREEEGDLEASVTLWEPLVKLSDEPEDLERGWGLIAKKQIQDLKKAQALESELEARLDRANLEAKPATGTTPQESQALVALRLEQWTDYDAAFLRWEQLRLSVPLEPAPSPIIWLAGKKTRALKDKRPKDEKEAILNRQKIVTEQLALAKKQAEESLEIATFICQDIARLYEKETDPGIKQLVDQAQALAKKIQPTAEKQG